mmetsp:Transcript_24286/g.54019  ORF Transcript_24286/g.54019 Transcript_24286/m.54019 type:complete len:206 (-) Transcript_24286:480-1097(-)
MLHGRLDIQLPQLLDKGRLVVAQAVEADCRLGVEDKFPIVHVCEGHAQNLANIYHVESYGRLFCDLVQQLTDTGGACWTGVARLQGDHLGCIDGRHSPLVWKFKVCLAADQHADDLGVDVLVLLHRVVKRSLAANHPGIHVRSRPDEEMHSLHVAALLQYEVQRRPEIRGRFRVVHVGPQLQQLPHLRDAVPGDGFEELNVQVIL